MRTAVATRSSHLILLPSPDSHFGKCSVCSFKSSGTSRRTLDAISMRSSHRIFVVSFIGIVSSPTSCSVTTISESFPSEGWPICLSLVVLHAGISETLRRSSVMAPLNATDSRIMINRCIDNVPYLQAANPDPSSCQIIQNAKVSQISVAFC